jgi:hypothetical protein
MPEKGKSIYLKHETRARVKVGRVVYRSRFPISISHPSFCPVQVDSYKQCLHDTLDAFLSFLDLCRYEGHAHLSNRNHK